MLADVYSSRTFNTLLFLLIYLCVVASDDFSHLQGSWSGDLQYYDNTCSFIQCSFQLDISVSSIYISIGSGCFPDVVSCLEKGSITSITNTTMSLHIPGCENPTPNQCFCHLKPSGVSLCLRYKASGLKMVVSMHKDVGALDVCPGDFQKVCGNETVGPTTQVGELECGDVFGLCAQCPLRLRYGKGLCNEGGGCDCFSGWKGIHCERSVCPGDCCNGNGICDARTEMCKCIKPWAGKDCSNTDIYGGKEGLWTAFAYLIMIPLCVSLMTVYFKCRENSGSLPVVTRVLWAYLNSEEAMNDNEDDEVGAESGWRDSADSQHEGGDENENR